MRLSVLARVKEIIRGAVKRETEEKIRDEILQCLENFEFCYPMTDKERKRYNIDGTGFFFPSLRPKDTSLALELPEDVTTLGLLIESKDDTLIGSKFFFSLARYSIYIEISHKVFVTKQA